MKITPFSIELEDGVYTWEELRTWDIKTLKMLIGFIEKEEDLKTFQQNVPINEIVVYIDNLLSKF